MVQYDPLIAERGREDPDEVLPVASMVEQIVGCKWSVTLLQACADGHRRPSALLRACPGLSAKPLVHHLVGLAGSTSSPASGSSARSFAARAESSIGVGHSRRW